MKAMNVVLKWRNKFSGEEGFVKSVSKTSGHFINTFDINEAKHYNRDKQLTNDQNNLELIGETVNNDFFVVNIG